MKSKTCLESSPLARILPGAQFGEAHSGVVDAPRERVWEALGAMGWTDLYLARPLMALRGLAPVTRDRIYDTFVERAGAVLQERLPDSSCLVMVGKPWSLVPQHARVATIEEVRAFAAPGWLKYGMEWRLHTLDDGRTLVETRTLCEATSVGARQAFRAYWTLIRLGSGAIRLDMIAALLRLTAAECTGA